MFNKELCIACTICVEACPAGALDIAIANSINGFRRYPVLAEPDRCTGCGSCEAQCISGALTMTTISGS